MHCEKESINIYGHKIISCTFCCINITRSFIGSFITAFFVPFKFWKFYGFYICQVHLNLYILNLWYLQKFHHCKNWRNQFVLIKVKLLKWNHYPLSKMRRFVCFFFLSFFIFALQLFPSVLMLDRRGIENYVFPKLEIQLFLLHIKLKEVHIFAVTWLLCG